MRPWVALFGCLALPLLRAPASACIPSAERVLAWDLARDLVVVGVWPERGVPPSDAPPGGFELRRISTGEKIAARDCAAACDFRTLLAPLVPAQVRWRTEGTRPARLRLKQIATPDGLEVAFETHTRAGWRWLLWVQVMGPGEAAQEQRSYLLGPTDVAGREALVSFEMRAHGGNCPYAFTRAFRVARADLADPLRPTRPAALLARPRKDQPFEHWRTIATLGPLPLDRLLEALEAAENGAQVATGARWWRETTSILAAEPRARLVAALRAHPHLESTRKLLGL